MLFGHGPTETIFVTYEDDAGKTHVMTGDGDHRRTAAHRIAR